MKKKYPCPCCEQPALVEKPPGTYLICPVCGWEDDPVQFADAHYTGGANRVSLAQARENFRRLGVSDPDRKPPAKT